MLATVSVQGEADLKPFTQVFEYATKSDECVFFEAANAIKKRVLKGLKININEALVLFVDLIMADLVADRPTGEIQRHASELLSPEKVLIGVAESMQVLTFVISVGDLPRRKIILNAPIQTYTYVINDGM